MRKLVLTAAAASAALGLAAPAFAQDSSQDSGKVPFSGIHVEALGGFDHLGSSGQGSRSGDGFVYGGAAGYDKRIGNIVVGVDGEVDGSTADSNTNNVLTAGDRLHISAGRDLYAGGRIGYVVAPKMMVYGKAGYSNARINSRYELGNASFEDHRNLDGYRLGAGVEYNLTHTAFVKAEYRYSHYGKDIPNFDITNVDRQQVLGGVGFRF